MSTYAPTIETIQKRYYVRLAAKRFEPTELGEIVNKLIVEYFPDIVNVTFTAEMEGKLDDVEVGKEQWQRVIDAFYKPFSKEVAKAEEEMEKIQIKDEPAGFECVVVQWSLNLVVLVSSTLVAISQIAAIPKQS